MSPSRRQTAPGPENGVPSGVRLDRDGPVATVTLCRPETLNAQTAEMWAELRTLGNQLPGDVRIVVVRGEGRAFSSGLDLRAASADGNGLLHVVARLPVPEAERRIAEFQEAFAWLRRPDLITVAAVRGYAIGAGFQLALACDLRVLAEDAHLAMAETGLGLVPDLGGTKRLVELVGYARALEICVTGRPVLAAEADRLGLANRVVPGDRLDDAVAELVAAVLAVPRDAAVETKALLAAAAGRDFAAQLTAEREAQVRRIQALAGLGE